jgi:hypothetical protein
MFLNISVVKIGTIMGLSQELTETMVGMRKKSKIGHGYRGES